ncbi:MAG: hypothetical protein QOC71_401 [Thermoplasmata archaeon]|jgi:hypothetical protein|nr:hypothetical protein [Thermoplasmata archaeon]
MVYRRIGRRDADEAGPARERSERSALPMARAVPQGTCREAARAVP